MATYNLNLSIDYCQHWGVWEAIREILQNGEDQFTLNNENEISVFYDEKKSILSISNKESILERKTLLLGGTSKADNPDLIGKFGEGYKIALLILTKLNKSTIIKNYKKNEKWIPSLDKDSKYDNERVLKVKIDKYLFKGDRDNNLTFEINNITKEDWSLINENYLRYQKIEKKIDLKDGSQILLDEKHKGNVYVNGLFIEKIKSKMAYGYNLKPNAIKLDRDRKTVEGFDFSIETSRILILAAKEKLDFKKELSELILKDDFEDLKYVVTNLFYFSSQTFNVFYDNFNNIYKNENPSLVFPVDTETENKSIKKKYPSIKTAIVSNKMKLVLSSNENYKTIESFISINNIEANMTKLSPTEEMESFFDKIKEKISMYYVEDEVEKILKISKGWINNPNEAVEEVIDDKVIDDNISEDIGLNEEFLIDEDGFEFYDDIPF